MSGKDANPRCSDIQSLTDSVLWTEYRGTSDQCESMFLARLLRQLSED